MGEVQSEGPNVFEGGKEKKVFRGKNLEGSKNARKSVAQCSRVS